MLASIAVLALIHGQAAVYKDRMAGASRQERAGWICIHISGAPRTLGYQHGRLLAKEILDAKQAVELEEASAGLKWQWFRDNAYLLYWKKLDPEYQEEIQGIAEGANSKGVSLDYKDVLALSAHIELADYYQPWLRAKQTHAQIQSKAPMACSAFMATGSFTKDGRLVVGQNFWWSYFTGARWRVIEYVQPAKGHSFVMDLLPGMIHSGSDWAQNDAGIVLTETTITDFEGYEPEGIPEFQRMRKAIQYSNSIDEVVQHFKQGNNGGYANTWLIADAKTNEIAKLQLGLRNVVLDRTRDGAFYGANYPEDAKLIEEEAPRYAGEPPDNVCELRRLRWQDLLSRSKGEIEAEMAKSFLGDTYNTQTGENDGQGSALCGKGFPFDGAVSARVTTGALVDKMGFWGRSSIPDGTSEPRADAIRQFTITGERARLWPDLPAQPWILYSPRG